MYGGWKDEGAREWELTLKWRWAKFNHKRIEMQRVDDSSISLNYSEVGFPTQLYPTHT